MIGVENSIKNGSHPVVGYREIALGGNRKFSIWYPVDSNLKGNASESHWEKYGIALNAPIYKPESKKPVIVISHGYGGRPHQLAWLIQRLVESGSIVLGTEHLDIHNEKVQINHWQRPQDVRRMIDLFSSSPISKWADMTKIGVAGFSLGGTTAVWLAGGKASKLDAIVPGPNHAFPGEFDGVELGLLTLDKEKMSRDWTDKRIKAAFVMAPAWSWIFDEKSLGKITIPTYFIGAEKDNVIVTKTNAGFFAGHIPKALLHTIGGEANHYIFISPSQKDKLPPHLHFLIQDHQTVDRSQIQKETADKAVAFFRTVFEREA